MPAGRGTNCARADRLKAHIAFARSRGGDTPLLLRAAAQRLESLDPELARQTHLEALWAAVRSGRFARDQSVVEAAEAANASLRGRSTRAIDLMLDGLTCRMQRGYAAALPLVARALDAFQQEGFGRREHHLVLACLPTRNGPVEDGGLRKHRENKGLGVIARERGELTVLPFALNYSAAHHLFAGGFDLAERLIDEADRITNATGNVPIADFSVLLAAWRGDRGKTHQLCAAIIPDATARGEGFAVEAAEWAAATLHIGKGDYADAVTAAQRAYDPDGLGFNVWVLPELIEAAARNGDFVVARTAFEKLTERSSLSNTDGRAASRPVACAAHRWTRRRGPYREAIEQLGVLAWPSTTPARNSSTASGFVVNIAASMRVPSSRQLTGPSMRWARGHSPGGRNANFWPLARRCVNAPPRRPTRMMPSHRRKRRSPTWLMKASPTPRSADSYPQPPHRRVAFAKGLHQAGHQFPPRTHKRVARLEI